ncbi:hypothetical protein AL346_11540 [Chelatococcus sp. CO-6]|nr:hypothetical protein AL346_11540 [Chelatococcus sp. CO-6]
MMTRIVLIALAAVAALMLITPPPASAQPYGWGQRPYEDDYDDWRPRRPPPRNWRDDGWDRGGWERPRPRGERYGSVCVTSRGQCNAGFRAPRNTPCRCFIPGFGEKRGAIGY